MQLLFEKNVAYFIQLNMIIFFDAAIDFYGLTLEQGFSASALLRFEARIFFVVSSVLCIVACFAASQPSTHYTLVAPPSQCNNQISRHCQMSWGGRCKITPTWELPPQTNSCSYALGDTHKNVHFSL